MVRALVAALLLCTVAASPASAESRWEGGCAFQEREDSARPGVMAGPVVAYFVLHGTDNPVSAVVQCWVRVDGIEHPRSTFDGTAVVAGVGHVEYAESLHGNVHYCESVDFTSDDTETYEACYVVDYTQIPPYEVSQLLCTAAPPTCE